MDLAEFGMLMFDIKLLPKIFPISAIEDILSSESNERHQKGLELEAREYIEALIRVASRLYSKQSVAFGEPSDTQNLLTLSELFNEFLESVAAICM